MNTLASLGNANAFPLDTQITCYEKTRNNYSIPFDPYLVTDSLHSYDKILTLLLENNYEEAFDLATSNEDLYLMKHIYKQNPSEKRLQEILYLSCRRDNLKLVEWCLENNAVITEDILEVAKWSSRDSIVKLLEGDSDWIGVIGEWVLQQL